MAVAAAERVRGNSGGAVDPQTVVQALQSDSEIRAASLVVEHLLSRDGMKDSSTRAALAAARDLVSALPASVRSTTAVAGMGTSSTRPIVVGARAATRDSAVPRRGSADLVSRGISAMRLSRGSRRGHRRRVCGIGSQSTGGFPSLPRRRVLGSLHNPRMQLPPAL